MIDALLKEFVCDEDALKCIVYAYPEIETLDEMRDIIKEELEVSVAEIIQNVKPVEQSEYEYLKELYTSEVVDIYNWQGEEIRRILQRAYNIIFRSEDLLL